MSSTLAAAAGSSPMDPCVTFQPCDLGYGKSKNSNTKDRMNRPKNGGYKMSKTSKWLNLSIFTVIIILVWYIAPGSGCMSGNSGDFSTTSKKSNNSSSFLSKKHKELRKKQDDIAKNTKNVKARNNPFPCNFNCSCCLNWSKPTWIVASITTVIASAVLIAIPCSHKGCWKNFGKGMCGKKGSNKKKDDKKEKKKGGDKKEKKKGGDKKGNNKKKA